MDKEKIMKAVKPVICSQLKSPASAQFPVDTISIRGNDVIGYTVEGFVDSQNSYGAMIRNDFTANVSERNGTFVVTSSTVGKMTAKNNAKQFGINFGVSYLAITIFAVIMTALMFWIVSMSMGF